MLTLVLSSLVLLKRRTLPTLLGNLLVALLHPVYGGLALFSWAGGLRNARAETLFVAQALVLGLGFLLSATGPFGLYPGVELQSYALYTLTALGALAGGTLLLGEAGRMGSAASRLLVPVGLLGFAVALGLLLYLVPPFAEGLSLLLSFAALHPLSCTWGLAGVVKLSAKARKALWLPGRLADVAVALPLGATTIRTFLGYLPSHLGGFSKYGRGPLVGAPAEGFGRATTPTSSFLGVKAWVSDGFRWDTGLLLHAAAFVSLLLTSPRLVLNFLHALPWKCVVGSRDGLRLSLPLCLAPLAVVLEMLLFLAGFPHARFTLHGGYRITLTVHLGRLRTVVLLADGSHPRYDMPTVGLLTRPHGPHVEGLWLDFFRAPHSSLPCFRFPDPRDRRR